MPLTHPPGDAQADLAKRSVVIEQKAHWSSATALRRRFCAGHNAASTTRRRAAAHLNTKLAVA